MTDTRQTFTKEDILKILAVITLDFLPDEYSPEILETWINESIEILNRNKCIAHK